MGVPITRGAPGVFPVCPSRFAAFSYGHGEAAKLKRRGAGVVIILVRAWGDRQAQAPGRGGVIILVRAWGDPAASLPAHPCVRSPGRPVPMSPAMHGIATWARDAAECRDEGSRRTSCPSG